MYFSDPEQWNEEHISQWLKWIEEQFLIGPIDRNHMPRNGATLCSLSSEDFRKLTEDKKTAEILITHLAHLKQSKLFN